jgi:hypothetical protein
MYIEPALSSDFGFQTVDNFTIFLQLGNRLKACLEIEKINFQVLRKDGVTYFDKLSVEEQNYNLNHLRNYVETCEEVHRENHSLADSPFFLMKIFRKLGLRPVDDILEKIIANDVVEIYNSRNTQIFRNINFFKISSYTLDDLMSRPWWQLYKRKDEVIRSIFYYGSEVFSGSIRETIIPNVETHYLEEIDSNAYYKMNVDIKYMSPLNSINSEGGGICCLVIEWSQLITQPSC